MSKRLVFATPKPLPIPKTNAGGRLTWDSVKPVATWVALIGGIAAVSYFAYKYFKRSAEVSRIERGKELKGEELREHHIMEDVRKIGHVTKNERGVVPFEQFIQIFIVIRHHGKAKLEAEAESLKAKRREALRNSPN